MAKPILISISPNLLISDVLISLKYLLNPLFWSRWKNGRKLRILTDNLKNYLGIDNIYLVDSGRSALYLALKSLGITAGDEVILQPYTCMVVPNAIIWNQAAPIYVDINSQTLNIDPDLIEQKICSKTKAIIIQHTFGHPADIDKILAICQKHRLYLIEDLAHSFGGEYHGKKLGTFGDLTILTFGRDKIISSVSGGALVVNNKEFIKAAEKEINQLEFPGGYRIFQNLIHPIATLWIKHFYFSLNFGKMMLVVLQKLRLLNKVYLPRESATIRPSIYPQKMPNCLAAIGVNQIKHLDEFNARREEIVRYYELALNLSKSNYPAGDKRVYLRYPLFVIDPRKTITAGLKQQILLGDWYDQVIVPKQVNLELLNYRVGSCPVAEKLSSENINLPTYPSLTNKDLVRVVDLIKSASIIDL